MYEMISTHEWLLEIKPLKHELSKIAVGLLSTGLSGPLVQNAPLLAPVFTASLNTNQYEYSVVVQTIKKVRYVLITHYLE